MLIFGALQLVTVVIFWSLDLMTVQYAVGIVRKNNSSLRCFSLLLAASKAQNLLLMQKLHYFLPCFYEFANKFLQEEKEKRLEEMFESDLDNAFGNKYEPKEEIPEEGAVALAGKKTQETLSATDSIIEALDIAEVELKRIAEHEVSPLYPVGGTLGMQVLYAFSY